MRSEEKVSKLSVGHAKGREANLDPFNIASIYSDR
jgi:hypothetical protein